MMLVVLLVLVFLVVILTIAASLAIFGLYNKNTNVLCMSKKRLDGKTAVITGGTTGMGLEIAKDFAGRGARVIIACPFKEEGEHARKTVIEETENENVVFKLLDLSSLKSTRDFADDTLKTEKRLDILMNNAGVGVIDDFLTKDGINCLMQINYFGHFLLTILLLPLLKKSGSKSEPSRIVNVSSTLHVQGTVEIEHINKVGHYWPKVNINGNSKLCLLLFAREITKKLKGANVVINSVDPGAVGTDIFRKNGLFSGQLACTVAVFLYKTLSKSPWEGAQTSIYVALDKKAGKTCGEFYKNCGLHAAKKEAYDDEKAAALWKASLQIVKISNEELDKIFEPIKNLTKPIGTF